MSAKATGLEAFSRRGGTAMRPALRTVSAAAEQPRQRAKKGVVALTVRLERAEWERLHQLAAAEGMSLQALAVRGLNLVFAEKGLPHLG